MSIGNPVELPNRVFRYRPFITADPVTPATAVVLIKSLRYIRLELRIKIYNMF
jgi:hypothetical protein